MPRAHPPAASSLRNRNRVTNKTRLKVIRGDIDGDPLSFDEDMEKARVVSTAGVDAEDANEHHLQAVLSAASQRNQSARATRGAEKDASQKDAYIPIPDNTGLVDDWESLYPANRWREPVSYFKTSETIEEAVADALAGGFTYYMDERDKEWLDKNNEEARGEGTSAQGAVSANGGTTRTSQRSAKSKGKDPEVALTVTISEDEFELVMGIFEKTTQEKTPFLHHGLENNTAFPSFSDYQDVFGMPLPATMFATFVVPGWVPQPAQLLRLAKAMYPYWKERRIERQGHRVIPTLNYDESDVKNESYICFRRRDVKAMRKTRASQASSSEKLLRLQQELATTQELSRSLCMREQLKRELTQAGRSVWDKREEFVALKRKYPVMASREDEELLYDKERVPKKPKVLEQTAGRIGIKIRTPRESEPSTPAANVEPVTKPKDRYASISSRIEASLADVRIQDSCWEDVVDNSYQAPPTTLPQRKFKFVFPPSQPPPTSVQFTPLPEDTPPLVYRAVRTRRGRGGVLRIDRRAHKPRASQNVPEVPPLPSQAPVDEASRQAAAEAEEHERRLRDRWRFDNDDEPPVGPDGPDEQDRVMVDEYDPKYLLKRMTLLTRHDAQTIATNPALTWSSVDGRQHTVMPFRNTYQLQEIMNEHARNQAKAQAQAQAQAQAAATASAGQLPATPVQAQQPVQEQATLTVPHPHPHNTLPVSQTPIRRSSSAVDVTTPRRVTSNGAMRPPATPQVLPLQPVVSSSPQNSPSQPTPSPRMMAMAHSPRPPSSTSLTAAGPSASPLLGEASVSSSNGPMPIKLPSHHAITMPNVYPMNGFPSTHPNGVTYILPNGGPPANPVNLQTLKAYAAMNNQDIHVHGLPNGSSRPAAYMGHVPNGASYSLQVPMSVQNGGVNVPMNMNMNMQGVNMNLKMPPQRQMQSLQWAASQGSPSPQQLHASPPNHAMKLAHGHGLPAHMHGGGSAQQGSPPRASQSPSMQQQQQHQIVGGLAQGY